MKGFEPLITGGSDLSPFLLLGNLEVGIRRLRDVAEICSALPAVSLLTGAAGITLAVGWIVVNIL